MSDSPFLDELISTLGADVAQRGADVAERYHTDWSGTPPQRPWPWCARAAPKTSAR